ncbi:MAG: hypothetical protein ABGY72_02070 [bacterium]
MRTTQLDIPSGTTLVNQFFLEGNLEFVRFDTVPDTPDRFGATAPVAFGNETPYFIVDGMLVDGAGATLSGTMFLGLQDLAVVGACGHGVRRHRSSARLQLERHDVGRTVTRFTRATSSTPGRATPGEVSGFTLVETLFALAIMTTGLLSLAGVFSYGMLALNRGDELLIAKEKATEGIESVFLARDTLTRTWGQVRNQTAGGIFLNGAHPVAHPGPDGLVNTPDDGPVEVLVQPGADGLAGTADDATLTLDGYSREIEITDLNPNLRQIRVIVRYPYGDSQREYELLTYISAFS